MSMTHPSSHANRVLCGRRQRRRGYVLLMTVILIALASVTLMTVARGSLRAAMDASRAVRDVQQRWLALSAQRTILPKAAAWFEQESSSESEDAPQPPPSEVLITQVTDAACNQRLHLDLGDLAVEVVVTDEQAKIHVPSLVARRGRGEAELAIRRAVRKIDSPVLGAATIDVHLQPYDPPELEAFKLPSFGSYGQIFDNPQPEDLIHLSADEAAFASPNDGGFSPTDLVTCWGDGRVNLCRAPAAVLTATCEPLIGPLEVDHLLALRQNIADPSTAELDPLLEQLDISADTQAKLADRLTLRSSCFGLWVIIKDDRRTWRHFAVSAASQPSSGGQEAGMMRTFSW